MKSLYRILPLVFTLAPLSFAAGDASKATSDAKTAVSQQQTATPAPAPAPAKAATPAPAPAPAKAATPAPAPAPAKAATPAPAPAPAKAATPAPAPAPAKAATPAPAPAPAKAATPAPAPAPAKAAAPAPAPAPAKAAEPAPAPAPANVVEPAPAKAAENTVKVNTDGFDALSGDTLPVVNGTVLAGNISGFLTVDKSPYLVNDSLIVGEGQALVIQPGVVIAFKPNAFLDVRGGSLAVVGEEQTPVVFRPFNKMGHWGGIRIAGPMVADFKNVFVRNAIDAISVENGSASLQNIVIDKSLQSGVHARGAKVNLQNSIVTNSRGVGVWASENATVRLDNMRLTGNKVGILAEQKAEVRFNKTVLEANEYAVLNMGENNVHENGSTISGNRIGVVSAEFPVNFRDAISYNEEDAASYAMKLHSSLPKEPKNPNAANYSSNTPILEDYDPNARWKMSGNVVSDVGYHLVRTRHNHTGGDFITGTDTVKNGDYYENYFQTPGFFANLNAHMLLQSPWGNSLELTMDMSSDSWNNFNPHVLQAIYTDPFQKLSLGNIYLSAGNTYLEGVDVLGGAYDLNIAHNRNGDPLFVVSAFGGETRKPLIEGEKNPDIYKDYVEKGEAESQEMIVGGKVRWNMHPLFSGTLGFMGSKDYVEDPFIRDGMSENVILATPLRSSQTAFAEGSWIAYPGNMEFHGNIAMGAADTSNARAMRAVNQVFSKAGLNSANYGLLNRLMNNVNEVSRLDKETLEEIFGDNTLLTVAEMRAKLKTLLEQAKSLRNELSNNGYENDRLSDWNGKNVAFGADFRWTFYKSELSAYLHAVGPEFYSAGSPDQLQNFREFGAVYRQTFSDFWNLTLTYDVDVENAGTENKYNAFGFNEGTTWGLFNEATEEWLDEHELDENRAINIQDASVKNVINIGSHVDLTLGYAMNYRTHHRSTRLYADYDKHSGVYEDAWFRPNGSNPTIQVNDTLEVDSARWAEYYSFAEDSCLASDFTERLLKQTAQINFDFKLPYNVLSLGGAFTFRSDLSEFANDKALDKLKFSDETYGLLGYYFHGGDYFEQRYPVSLTTTVGPVRNVIAFTPRYKIFERNDMTDFEWYLSDNFTWDISRDFLELTLAGSLRRDILEYTDEGEDFSEEEIDVDGSVMFRVYITRTFFTDWTLGAVYDYRPDSRSDEYKDFYGILSLNYAF